MKKTWIDASIEALELNETAQWYHGNYDDGCYLEDGAVHAGPDPS